MAEFQKVMADAGRMCPTQESCAECEANRCCPNYYMLKKGDGFAQFETIVEQWAEEHPAKNKSHGIASGIPEYRLFINLWK